MNDQLDRDKKVVNIASARAKRSANSPGQKITKPWVKLLFWAAIILVLLVLLARFPSADVHQMQVSEHSFRKTEDGHYEIVIRLNKSNQYVLQGKLNGMQVKLIVDTGATGVSVPGLLADKAHMVRLAQLRSTTAAGETTSYRTIVASLDLGELKFSKFDASITPAMTLDGLLLGMSILKNFDIRIGNKVMTLRCKIGSTCYL